MHCSRALRVCSLNVPREAHVIPEFRAWPKTPRLRREVVITEKIDGTNACVIVDDEGVYAQSRKRLITPTDDNFGFAAWVDDNWRELAEVLGHGYHYGEWWGHGIQRGYGLSKGDRRFSLFDVRRYAEVDLSAVPGLGLVPELFPRLLREQPLMLADDDVQMSLDYLKDFGSLAAEGFDRPEGIVVFHRDARQAFKVLLESDDVPKSVVQGESQ